MNYSHDIPVGCARFVVPDFTYFLSRPRGRRWPLLPVARKAPAIMVRMHFRFYRNVTRENISDAMTGLQIP